MLITVLIGVVVLSLLTLSHEFGHFITAKWAGVRVEEFGLGFPPRLVSFKHGETIYSINVIFFGGFTRLSGEEDPEKPGSLAGKSRGSRFMVLSAGSLMNLLLALILFSAGYLSPREAATGRVTVEAVAANSPAAATGIEPGDVILSVNDQPVDSSDTLHQYVTDNLGKTITVVIQQPDSTTRSVQLVPRLNPPEGEGAMGVATSTLRRYPLWQTIPLGAKEFGETVVMWVGGLVSIFTNNTPASFIGPVGIVQLTGEVAKFGVVPLLRVSALISLILGIMNLLPLPAIDGGRITFLFLELVRGGKRVPPKIERLVHLVGFALFLLLFLAVTYQDILRIVSGQGPIP